MNWGKRFGKLKGGRGGKMGTEESLGLVRGWKETEMEWEEDGG